MWLKKVMPGERKKGAGLTLTEEVRRTVFECIDRFHQELHIRSKAMEDALFIFSAIQPKSLIAATEEKLDQCIPKLCKMSDEL